MTWRTFQIANYLETPDDCAALMDALAEELEETLKDNPDLTTTPQEVISGYRLIAKMMRKGFHPKRETP